MISSVSKKWRLLRAYLSRVPVWCTWQVTYRCNFRCGFCHYWRDPMGRLPEQSIEQIEEGSAKLAKLGTLLISVAGGEPLLRADIVDVVRAVGRYHFPFITTNGWLLTEAMADALFEAGIWGVSVSLDYADPKRHDRRRGMPGSFDQAVRALRCCSRARRHPWQRVNLMCVLLHDNLDHLEPLLQLAQECDAYFMVQPYGQRKTGNGRFVPASDGVVARLLDLKARYRNFLSNASFLEQFEAALNGGVPGCLAGRTFFNIDSSGDVAICVEERERPVANLYRDPAWAVVERLRRASKQNPCQACWYNCRGETESLYEPFGLVRSLPTLLFDHGRPGG